MHKLFSRVPMSRDKSIKKTIRSISLLFCVFIGEYGNMEYHSGLINRPNGEGGSEAIMESRLIKKKKKKHYLT